MAVPTPSQYRKNWFIILGALTVVPVAYAVLARMIAPRIPPSPTVTTLRYVFMGVAGVQFLVGAFLLLRARVPAFLGAAETTPPAEALAAPAQFLARSVVGMALFEAVGVYGFLLVFLGNDPGECLVWSAVSLIGMLGVALPMGAAYWRDLAQPSAGPAPPLG